MAYLEAMRALRKRLDGKASADTAPACLDFRRWLLDELRGAGIDVGAPRAFTEAALAKLPGHTLLAWASDYEFDMQFYAIPDAVISPTMRIALDRVAGRCFAAAADCTPEIWGAALRVMAALGHAKDPDSFVADHLVGGARRAKGPTPDELRAIFDTWSQYAIGAMSAPKKQRARFDKRFTHALLVNQAM